MTEPNKATLIFAQGLTLYAGPVADTEPHRHHAIQVVFSFAEPFHIDFERESLSTRCVVVNRDVEHRFLGQENPFLFFYIEPESEFGGHLQSKLSGAYECWESGTTLLAQIQKSIGREGLSIATVRKTLAQELNFATPGQGMDSRIARVIQLIDKTPHRKISVPLLASTADLSESRLQHLFKEQTGISMKRYMLWKRINDGIHYAAHGRDLSTAAYEAGFSDAAHMSRTFKDMFGIHLSRYFANSRSIQVSFENLE